MAHKKGKDILFIGLVCEDIISIVPEYPKEDDKIRCSSSILKRGGNAGNSAVVLSLLFKSSNNKNDIYFMGTLSNKQRSSFVVSDLNKYNINTNLCIYSDDHDMTVSYIIVSNKTKSRTIINNPCLKPLSFQMFIKSINGFNKNNNNDEKNDDSNIVHNLLNTIDSTLQFVNEYSLINNNNNNNILDKIEIIHIDARWITTMIQILSYIKKYHSNIFISIEIEKERLYNDDDGRLIAKQYKNPVNDLIPFADLIFFSRQLVKGRGYGEKENNPKQFIKDIIKEYGENRANPLTLIVPWGEMGAYGVKYDCSLTLYDEYHHQNIDIHHQKSYPPKEIVDTIGAGDTFIASYIKYAATHNIWKYDINQCLKYASQAAGYKIGHHGFDCMKNFKFDKNN